MRNGRLGWRVEVCCAASQNAIISAHLRNNLFGAAWGEYSGAHVLLLTITIITILIIFLWGGGRLLAFHLNYIWVDSPHCGVRRGALHVVTVSKNDAKMFGMSTRAQWVVSQVPNKKRCIFQYLLLQRFLCKIRKIGELPLTKNVPEDLYCFWHPSLYFWPETFAERFLELLPGSAFLLPTKACFAPGTSAWLIYLSVPRSLPVFT